ncbi:sulfotransferase [Nocardioides sp. YIM 152588]|uniref:sulfotransferase n=1 Tax=Nocardioides sp. YIM 152588 TaxID=3158259 RepID=UPI0032E4A6BB
MVRRLRRRPDRRRAALEVELERLREESARLRRRLGRLEGERDLGYLFVLTYGRSGSTLVQGILNSIPGFLIRGENRQALRHLWEFDRGLVAERSRMRRLQRRAGDEPGSSDTTAPWFGIDGYPHRRALALTRQLALSTLLRPDEDTRVTGFKEIRWDQEDTPEYVAWLREVFPGARFVINTRDLGAVSQSAWWGEQPGATAKLVERERVLDALAGQLGEVAYRVHYDEFTADPTVLRGLFDWLGEAFDEERVRAVLDTRHSYQPPAAAQPAAEGDVDA